MIADDVSEENIPFWDHTGEDLETASLLGSFREEDSPLLRAKRPRLSEEDVLDLIDQLDETSCMLQEYLTDLRKRKDKDTVAEKKTLTTHRYNPCSACRRVIDRLTGTKTIIFTIVLQGLNLVIQTLIDVWPSRDETTVLFVSCFSMILLQLFNLILIIITSGKLASEMYHSRRVSGILLLQSYCASVLLFAGLYTITRRLDKESWKYLKEDVRDDPALIVQLYCNLLFFSVSTATLCGSSDLSPHEWYNYLLVALQMLLSFMYFASIMGHCLPNITKKEPSTRKVTPSASSRRPSRMGSRNSVVQIQSYGSNGTTSM